MIESTPASPKKNRTWVWIVVAVAVTSLCCLVILAGAFAFAAWKGYIFFPGHNTRSFPTLTSPLLPNRDGGPQATPNAAPSSLTVEPYLPKITDHYPVLQELVPDWKNPTAPTTNTYNLSLQYTQPVLLTTGWCTTTQAILDQNIQHIQYIFEVDGKSVNISQFFKADQKASDRVCQQYIGLVRAWPTGSHTIKITMRMNGKINDGWNDYATGDYVEVYNITVTP
jgi:hypothetical protein